MENFLKEKLLNFVKKGVMFDSFTEAEFTEIQQCLDSQNGPSLYEPQFPQLMDSQTAMGKLHCDKHRLNYYLNQGYLKRVKFGYRKIMIDSESLRNFMTNGIAVDGGEA